MKKNNLIHNPRHLRRHLASITLSITAFLNALDDEMKKPSDVNRGKRIAKLSNWLEMANDSAKHFGLSMELKKQTPPPD